MSREALLDNVFYRVLIANNEWSDDIASSLSLAINHISSNCKNIENQPLQSDFSPMLLSVDILSNANPHYTLIDSGIQCKTIPVSSHVIHRFSVGSVNEITQLLTYILNIAPQLFDKDSSNIQLDPQMYFSLPLVQRSSEPSSPSILTLLFSQITTPDVTESLQNTQCFTIAPWSSVSGFCVSALGASMVLDVTLPEKPRPQTQRKHTQPLVLKSISPFDCVSAVGSESLRVQMSPVLSLMSSMLTKSTTGIVDTHTSTTTSPSSLCVGGVCGGSVLEDGGLKLSVVCIPSRTHTTTDTTTTTSKPKTHTKQTADAESGVDESVDDSTSVSVSVSVSSSELSESLNGVILTALKSLHAETYAYDSIMHAQTAAMQSVVLLFKRLSLLPSDYTLVDTPPVVLDDGGIDLYAFDMVSEVLTVVRNAIIFVGSVDAGDISIANTLWLSAAEVALSASQYPSTDPSSVFSVPPPLSVLPPLHLSAPWVCPADEDEETSEPVPPQMISEWRSSVCMLKYICTPLIALVTAHNIAVTHTELNKSDKRSQLQHFVIRRETVKSALKLTAETFWGLVCTDLSSSTDIGSVGGLMTRLHLTIVASLISNNNNNNNNSNNVERKKTKRNKKITKSLPSLPHTLVQLLRLMLLKLPLSYSLSSVLYAVVVPVYATPNPTSFTVDIPPLLSSVFEEVDVPFIAPSVQDWVVYQEELTMDGHYDDVGESESDLIDTDDHTATTPTSPVIRHHRHSRSHPLHPRHQPPSSGQRVDTLTSTSSSHSHPHGHALPLSPVAVDLAHAPYDSEADIMQRALPRPALSVKQTHTHTHTHINPHANMTSKMKRKADIDALLVSGRNLPISSLNHFTQALANSNSLYSSIAVKKKKLDVHVNGPRISSSSLSLERRKTKPAAAVSRKDVSGLITQSRNPNPFAVFTEGEKTSSLEERKETNESKTTDKKYDKHEYVEFDPIVSQVLSSSLSTPSSPARAKSQRSKQLKTPQRTTSSSIDLDDITDGNELILASPIKTNSPARAKTTTKSPPASKKSLFDA